MSDLEIIKYKIPGLEEPVESVNRRVTEKIDIFIMKTGLQPTKIFISIELIEELLIEMLPDISKFKGIKRDPTKKNQINGLDAYRVIEPGIIEVV
jgi:hypothetical protein